MKTIKGSKTEQNLLKAFAGESQARNRYTFFAKRAKKEGYEQIAAIFNETAAQEQEHAELFFKFLEGGKAEINEAVYPAGRIGTTADQDVVGWMGKMKASVEKHSPNVKCIVEMTWGRKNGSDATKGKRLLDLKEAHPEYFASYGAMQKVITANTTAMAQKLGLDLSPVGVAWEIVRQERPDIELYVKDGSHPSDAGSYLAAAVGYLTLFKEPFKADTPVRLKPEVARYLRSVAERVVLKAN